MGRKGNKLKGRKCLPTKLKILKGSQKTERINPNEPEPTVAIPTPPAFLTEEAMTEWRRITPLLEDLGLIAHIDRATIASYCQTWGRIERYEALVAANERGELCTSVNGHVQPSPEMAVLNRAYDRLQKLLTEFGMSPASRARVASSKPKEQSVGFRKFQKNG